MVHLNPSLVLHLSCLMCELTEYRARAGINRSWGGGGGGGGADGFFISSLVVVGEL